jgi:hypothetical protein
MKKPNNMTEAQWAEWLENGVGPCEVLLGRNYCGKPVRKIVMDIKEMTKPEDSVVHYKILGSVKFCPEHEREAVSINADGTVTFGNLEDKDEPAATKD